MYNFLELKTKIAVLVQRSDDSNYIDKIGVWVNLAHNFLSDVYDYYTELQETHNFSTVDGQEDYPLPNNFVLPFRLYDLTEKKQITIQTQEEYFDGNIANIAALSESEPGYARIYGVSGIRVPLTAASTIQVKSSSSSDTDSVVVRIRGYIDSSHLIEDEENITISIVDPTTYSSGTKTFYKITHTSKDKDTTGYISIANSTPTVLNTLAPYDRVMRHKVLKLGLIPDSVNSMRLLFKKKAPILVNNNDYPFTECDNFLILDGWGWALSQEKETMDRAAAVWSKAKDALTALLRKQNAQLGPDYQHKIESMWLSAHKI